MTPVKERFTLRERSWIMYDWANSVYATNIMAAIFPTIFVSLAGDAGDMWWGYGTSIATFLIAILAPLLGAIADYRGMKKKLFTVFMLLGVVFTALIAATNDWRFMLAAYIVSRIGFSGANLFYDSFLTDVTTNERMDKVSSWGYAMGYIGGSTIPFVISIAVLLWQGYDSVFAQKFSILITSVWWIVFSIPFIKNVEQVHHLDDAQRPTFSGVLQNIGNTARDIAAEKGMLMFILAYFFYIDGVGTVISISTAYGTALGLGAVGMILALLVTQVVAMPCSILFARLSKKISTRRALLFAIAVYMVICLVGFIMGYTLEPHQDAYNGAYATHAAAATQESDFDFDDPAQAGKARDNLIAKSRDLLRDGKTESLSLLTFAWDNMTDNDAILAKEASAYWFVQNQAFIEENTDLAQNFRSAITTSTIMFWAMAVLVGTVQGGIQATSRSYFGKLIPKKRSNEFFGFFDIFGKFASVIGPFLYAFVGGLTGRSSYGTLCLMALFLVGFIVLWRGKIPMEQLEKARAKNGERV
ncbi:MAG: MFS transporter [Eubacteriales bacterium]|jgi:UMF1 family MFS transporter|nr:MFS transporter [Eubacteriales bacterium]MDD4105917.1 MFS transporter [Eubacteriales bacterium]MDD4711160.1 MFS transporter [Eubacteriales bacterium]